jgi:uncharacterized protein
MALNQWKMYVNRSNSYFFLRFTIIIILYELIAGLTYTYYDIGLENPLTKQPFILDLIGSIIVAPLFETWLCQYLPLRFLRKWIGNKINSEIVYISISALLFASMHPFSIWYLIFTIIPGVLLAYFFSHFYKLYQSLIVSFWFTAILHSVINVASIVYDFLV